MGEDNRTSALQSIWNFDGAELHTLFELKSLATVQFIEWDLEGVYWTLRSMRRELDAKLDDGSKKKKDDTNPEDASKKKETERETVNRLMNELEIKRNNYQGLETKTEKDKGEYYIFEENFYMELCRLMKKHGFYFRENDDPSQAILRR